MRSLVLFESAKLLRERQFQVSVLLIAANLVYVYFFFTTPANLGTAGGTPFANWLASGTSDTAFILYFLGLSTATVFAGDYTYKTYQNFVPYTTMPRILAAKMLVNMIALFALLLFWYLLASVFAGIRAGSFDIGSLQCLVLRSATQYPHVVFNGSILAIVAGLTRNRGITNIALVLSWIAYGFLPVGGTPFYGYVSRSVAWGAAPDALLVAFFVLCAAVFYLAASAVMSKRDVAA